RYALPGLIAVLILLAVGITTAFSYRAGQQTANDVANRLSAESAQRVHDRVLSFLQTPRDFLEINLAATRSGNVDPDDLQALGRRFWEQVNVTSSVPSIYYGNAKGEFLYYGNDFDSNGTVVYVEDTSAFPTRRAWRAGSNGNPTGPPLLNDTYDPRTRPFYQLAAKEGDLTWSPITTFAAQHNTGITA